MNFMNHAVDSAVKLNQQLLFWQLAKDTVLSADSSWISFSDSMKNTSLGKTLGKNNRVISNSTHNFDVNLNSIDNIQQKIKGRQLLTRLDSTTILRVAQLCPYYDGIAVYFARNILLDMGYGNVVNPCELAQKKTLKQKRLANLNLTDFILYPNPTKEKINFEFEVENSDKVELFLFDILGKVQKRVILQPTIQHQFDVSELNAGIYIYKLIKNGELINSNKLIIQ